LCKEIGSEHSVEAHLYRGENICFEEVGGRIVEELEGHLFLNWLEVEGFLGLEAKRGVLGHFNPNKIRLELRDVLLLLEFEEEFDLLVKLLNDVERYALLLSSPKANHC